MPISFTTSENDITPELMPVGDYSATIIKSEDVVSKSSGKDQIRLELDTGRGHLWYYLTDGDPYIKNKAGYILQSAGVFAPGMQITSSAFRNLRVRLRVKHENYDGKLKATIAKWLTPGERTLPPPPHMQMPPNQPAWQTAGHTYPPSDAPASGEIPF